MKNIRWLWLGLIVLGVSSLLWGTLAAQAAGSAIYIVTGTADGVGSCAPGVGGNLCTTLQAAIIAANANPGSTVRLTHGATYTLTVAPKAADDATTGDLNLTADMNFDFGNTVCLSRCSATIQAGPAFGDRLIAIGPGAQVTAFTLTLRGGQTSTVIGGGGVYLEPGSAFTLTNAVVFSNSSLFHRQL